MSQSNYDGIEYLEVPDVFRQREFFEDSRLIDHVKDNFLRSMGRQPEQNELDWLILRAAMPFTSRALEASGELCDPTRSYALDVTPVEKVKLPGVDLEVFVKKEHAQKTGSVAVRGYLYSAIQPEVNAESKLITIGSRYQFAAFAYVLEHLGLSGQIFVPSDLEIPVLDPEVQQRLEINAAGLEFPKIELPFLKLARSKLNNLIPIHPINGFNFNTGKRSAVGEAVQQVPDAKHVYFPQDSALSGQGMNIIREAYGDIGASSVRLIPADNAHDTDPDFVEVRMARGALSSTRVDDHQAISTQELTIQQAAQGMVEYAEATGGELISLLGGSTIAAILRDAPSLTGRVLAIVDSGNITPDQFEKTLKAAAALS